MPSSTPSILYWDADVLLSYIEATPGRVENIRALLTEADNGEHEIVTSMLSVTEVASPRTLALQGSTPTTPTTLSDGPR